MKYTANSNEPNTHLFACGYARVTIKELTPTNRSYEILFQPDDKRRVPFDRKCNPVLEFMKKKWHPSTKQLECLSTFSINR